MSSVREQVSWRLPHGEQAADWASMGDGNDRVAADASHASEEILDAVVEG